jgi:predicted enzyme related to lactoylglutathione lyase
VAADGAGIGWCRALVFEVDDLERAAAFWTGLLGTNVVERKPGWVATDRDRGGMYLGFVLTEAERPRLIRARPDIEVQDLDAAQGRIEELGGRLVKIDPDPDGEHRLMADTEGNEFTILHPLPASERPMFGFTG